jgi:DNA-binding transcriptional LysR family regulator
VSWDDLRFFLAVARAGTLTDAARVLGVSGPTVGRRIAALETALGAKLFVRRATGYTPTDAGADLLAHAEGLEASMTALVRGVSGRAGKLSGTVRLATFDTLAEHVLVPALGRLRRAHPGIDLEIVTATRPVGLTRREADLAIRLVRPEQPGLVVRRVGAVGFSVYHAKTAARAPVTPARFARMDWIGWIDELSGLPPARWLAREAKGARVVLRANTAGAQLAAAKAGIGAAVLPCFVGDAEPVLRRLVAEPVLAEDLYLVQIPELLEAARVRAVTEFLVRLLREQASKLAGAGSMRTG